LGGKKGVGCPGGKKTKRRKKKRKPVVCDADKEKQRGSMIAEPFGRLEERL